MFEVRFRVDQGKHNAEIFSLDIAQKKEEKKRQETFAHTLISIIFFHFVLQFILFL
jgi:hypothetical protein